MTDYGAQRNRRGLFAGLLEERFTNIDLIVVIAALLITGLIGAISGLSMAS